MVKVVTAETEIKAVGLRQHNANLKAAGREVQNFGKSISSMSLAAKAGWAVAGTVIVQFVKDATTQAMRYQGVHRGFVNIIGSQNREFLASMKEASRGTISELALMENANKAITLGIDQELIPSLIEGSSKLGAALGRTTEEAFQDIAIGIGRQSKLILDNLGIIVNAEQAYKNYADSIGVAVSALTESEKRIAFQKDAIQALDEAVENVGDTLDDNVVAIQESRAAWEDFKVTVGEGVVVVLGDTLRLLMKIDEVLHPVQEQLTTIDKTTFPTEERVPGGTLSFGGAQFEGGDLFPKEGPQGFQGVGPTGRVLGLFNQTMASEEGLLSLKLNNIEREKEAIEDLGATIDDVIVGSRGRTREEARAEVLAGGGVVVE